MRSWMIVVGIVVAIGMGTVPVHGAVRYTITDLGSLGVGSAVSCINNAGAIVGYADTPEGTNHAILWEDGSLEDLSGAVGEPSYALAINDSGLIVGSSVYSPARQGGFLYDGQMHWDFPAGLYPTDINNSGEVVGQDQGYQTAALWQDGQMVLLDGLGGSSSVASAINDCGQIVGGAQVGDGQVFHATVWTGGVPLDLGTFGGSYSWARDTNAAGMVVGSSEDTNTESHAFVWYDGVMQDLGLGEAEGLNAQGQIVGTSGLLVGGVSSALLWEDGVRYDLNNLVDQGSGWQLLEARDINDSGAIVGEGFLNGQFRAFLLTPAPEPSSVALIAVVLCAWRRRSF